MSGQDKKNGQRENTAGTIRQWENTYGILDIFKDIIVLIAVTGFAFGWMFLMLLIISFITLSYLHFDIKVMFIISLITGISACVYYTVKTVKKYRGMTWKSK